MLHTIINQQNDNNLDTFYKAIIYLAKDFPKFNRFTSNENLSEILSNINNTATVLFLDLLPENITVSNSTVVNNTSKSFTTNIKSTITPQTESIQNALSVFNNKEVFICLQKRETQHLYGSTKEPLLLTFNELHSEQPGKVKGYIININGTTIEKTRFVNITEFNLVSRLLASPLASGL